MLSREIADGHTEILDLANRIPWPSLARTRGRWPITKWASTGKLSEKSWSKTSCRLERLEMLRIC